MKTIRPAPCLVSVSIALVAGASRSDAAGLTRRDTSGHHASTSEHRGMDRVEFDAAIRSGIQDFDEQSAVLELETQDLEPGARGEVDDGIGEPRERRAGLAAAFERLGSMLHDDGYDHEEDVAEMDVEPRQALDDAFEEVVEGARSAADAT